MTTRTSNADTTTVSSPTPISWQIALPDLIGPAPLALGRIEIAVMQGRAAGYAAVVDNVTNDGIAVMAESVRSDGTDYLLTAWPEVQASTIRSGAQTFGFSIQQLRPCR